MVRASALGGWPFDPGLQRASHVESWWRMRVPEHKIAEVERVLCVR